MKKLRVAFIYIAIFLVVMFLLDGFSMFGNNTEEVDYTIFLQGVRDDTIGKVVFQDNVINAWYRSSGKEKTDKDGNVKIDENGKPEVVYPAKADFFANVESNESFKASMAAIYADKLGKDAEAVTDLDYTFDYTYYQPQGTPIWLSILPYIFLLLTGVLVVFLVMRSQSSGGGAMSFGKSNARVKGDDIHVTFDDVEGADEEKAELAEVVEFLQNPKRFTDMGARIPKGVLLVGPPGTGKTLLAKAAAGESKVPFFSISGSDFVEMFVGVGASRVRDLFATAKKSMKAVIFIDEIDAVGRRRGAGLGGGHDEREQTLNQLLVEMDGFSANEGIIVIAATNRPDILDPALLRPGRFDRRITVNAPDIKGREAILRLHAKKKKIADKDISLEQIARSTPGFTGADLENLLNEAAILAARRNKSEITMEELNESITKAIMGPEKKSRKVLDADKIITAHHESGHAIAALMLKHCDPLREVSIVPRGMAAGYTITMPHDEYSHMSRSKLLDEIAMLLGGRAAESVALDDICTGAYNDLQRATEIARAMVVEYGMSEKVGPIFLGGDNEVFIGRDFAQHRNFSDAFSVHIDEEIKSIVETQYARIKGILAENIDGLRRVAAVLAERSALTGEEFERIYRNLPDNDEKETDSPSGDEQE